MTSLEARVQKVANANGLKNFASEIPFAELFRVQNLYMDIYKDEISRKGIVMKYDMIDKSCQVITTNDIPFMPYGHAIVSEAREELSMMYVETSNAYSVDYNKR
tara:strand:+ start:408 stop:719 length:312 start_codon:yes stop_codon:yes gene_type:complete